MQSPLANPDSHEAREESIVREGTTYEPVLPYTQATDETQAAQADSFMAVRLRAEAPVTIGPERVYEIPQRVWLPVPAGVDPSQVRLYYYHPNGHDRGWYPAENVEGWLVPDSYLTLKVNGTTYLGFLVRHAGIVQLGIPSQRK